MQHAARHSDHVARDETRADALWIVVYAVAMVGLLTLAMGSFSIVGTPFDAVASISAGPGSTN